MKLQGQFTCFTEKEVEQKKRILLEMIFNEKVVRKVEKFTLTENQNEKGNKVVNFEVVFDELPPQEFIQMICELNMDYFFMVTNWETQKNNANQQETEVENVDANQQETEVENVDTNQQETEVENVDADQQETEVENDDANQQESKVENDDANQQETEVEKVDANQQESKVENDDADQQETEVENVDADQQETEVENVDTNQQETEVENDDANQQESEIKKNKKGNYFKVTKVFIPDWVNLIAVTSKSFDEFVEKIAKKLMFSYNNKNYFISIINIIKDSDLSDSEIYTNKNFNKMTLDLNYVPGKVSYLSSIISRRLKDLNSPGTMMPFIKGIIQFKDYYKDGFSEDSESNDSSIVIPNQEESKSDIENSNEKLNIQEKSEDGDIDAKTSGEQILQKIEQPKSIRFCAFPPIPSFETWLATLDFSASISEIVISIMKKIGIKSKKSNPINQKIIDLTIMAVEMDSEVDSIEDYLNSAGINQQSKEAVDIRLSYASYLNDYVSKNYEGKFPNIRAYGFLKEMHKLIKERKE